MNLQKCQKTWLNEDAFKQRTELALTWLYRSFEVTGQQGFAGYFQKQPWELGKWSNAYPETTGYIIETLLDYEKITQNGRHQSTATQAADWLLSVQLENGSFSGGLIGAPPAPSVFNTGMILFGLERVYREDSTINNVYLKSMKCATNWLLEIMEANGRWQTGAYVTGHIPTYYSRVLWAMLLADRHFNHPTLKSKVLVALEFYRNRIAPDYFIEGCGFLADKAAPTHTLAYSLRGFLECALELNDKVMYEQTKSIATKLATLILKFNKAAGEYDSGWRGNYRFTCLTGNAQLSIIFLKLFELEKDELFFTAALTVFSPVIASQNLGGIINLQGAIPGSKPIWGKYFRFRYPNWGVKFFLDAYLLFIEKT